MTSQDIRARIVEATAALPAHEAVIEAASTDTDLAKAFADRNFVRDKIETLGTQLAAALAAERTARAKTLVDEETASRAERRNRLDHGAKDLLKAVSQFEKNVEAVVEGRARITRLATELDIPIKRDRLAHWSLDGFLDRALTGHLNGHSLRKVAEAVLDEACAKIDARPPLTLDAALAEMEWQDQLSIPDHGDAPLKESW